MSGIAFVVFVSLYFVRAGYGIFRTAQWGPSVNNKLGWILMEAPVFIVMFILWAWSGTGFTMPQYLFFLLFQLHYLQRSFVFPFLLKGKSRMPLSIMTMGIVFNILNGVMQAGGLFWFPNEAYASGLAYLSEPHALAGLFLFLAGMGINLHSDHVIRHLRKPGDTRHYLPMDRLCPPDSLAGSMGLCLVDRRQSCPARQRHIPQVYRGIRRRGCWKTETNYTILILMVND